MRRVVMMLVMAESLLLGSLLLGDTTAFGPLQSRTFSPHHTCTVTNNLSLLWSTTTETQDEDTQPNFNGVPVAKKGGQGAMTASQQALAQGLSLGAPPVRPDGGHYLTKGGVQVTAHVEQLVFSPESSAAGTSNRAIEDLIDELDSNKGVLLSSTYEFPGRYARWSLGFVDPPLEIAGRGQDCTITALNDRGKVLMPLVSRSLQKLKEDGILETLDFVQNSDGSGDGMGSIPERIEARVVPPAAVGTFSEEDRSRQASLFSVVRSLIDLFGYQGGDRQLGLYGAFGYDLTFQFEPIDMKQTRDPQQRDLLLYLPDKIVVVDQEKRDAWTVDYEFCVDQKSTQGMKRVGTVEPFRHFDQSNSAAFEARDTPEHEFSTSVEKAKKEFVVGNLFETVLSQTFREKLSEETPPSVLFRRLRSRNPAPYGFFINLGEQEYLVGASPEMFVRCEATNDNAYQPGAIRVETCPISGTVARGADALEDALRVKSLMMNAKEESELTMCTDVDRNDKSRICEPGSVQVIGRRQIEMYSRLIHTVDHVEGYLRPGFDALDAFLCHTWAVTVTGAPKTWAIQFVEDTERSPRCWYGGAVGMVGFDGSLNTGLTLRTVRITNGVGEVRAGATLLYDSDPVAEELETELKASAMIDAIVKSGSKDPMTDTRSSGASRMSTTTENNRSVILIDHEDSFVHTLGNYLRQTGASVRTLRSGPTALSTIEALVKAGEKPDLVVLSPGPGNPSDFGLSTTIDFLVRHRIPAFGVCLGLQGMVEHFGGSLGVLSYPMHGKSSQVTLTNVGKRDTSIFAGLPETFEVARYHSLHGIREQLPPCLEVSAQSDDGIVMGIQHKSLPLAAVQFHPESILTSPAHGMNILQNALKFLDYSNTDGPSTGVGIVSELEQMSVEELEKLLRDARLSNSGSKSDMVLQLALWQHKRDEFTAGRLDLSAMSKGELKDLKQRLGVDGAATSKSELLSSLEGCFTRY